MHIDSALNTYCTKNARNASLIRRLFEALLHRLSAPERAIGLQKLQRLQRNGLKRVPVLADDGTRRAEQALDHVGGRRNSGNVNEFLGVTDARTLQNALGKPEVTVVVVVVVRSSTWAGEEVAHSLALTRVSSSCFLSWSLTIADSNAALAMMAAFGPSIKYRYFQ